MGIKHVDFMGFTLVVSFLPSQMSRGEFAPPRLTRSRLARRNRCRVGGGAVEVPHPPQVATRVHSWDRGNVPRGGPLHPPRPLPLVNSLSSHLAPTPPPEFVLVATRCSSTFSFHLILLVPCREFVPYPPSPSPLIAILLTWTFYLFCRSSTDRAPRTGTVTAISCVILDRKSLDLFRLFPLKMEHVGTKPP